MPLLETTHPADLARTLERLAGAEVGGTAYLFQYNPEDWSLRRDTVSVGLDQDCLVSRCLLSGEPCSTGGEVAPGYEPWEDALALPVRRSGSVVGVLAVNRTPVDTSELEELAQAFALQLETVLEWDRARQALSRFQEFAVAAVEAQTEGARGHVAAVCQLAADLAEFLDLGAQARRRLWTAALYHDVGLVLQAHHGVLERDRTHPEAGAEFLRTSGVHSSLAPLVATHHERYDGSGYPNGLTGEQLSLEQWVLVLAEDFSEFWSANSHLGFTVRLGIFFKERARHHHPEVVDALAGLVDAERLERLR